MPRSLASVPLTLAVLLTCAELAPVQAQVKERSAFELGAVYPLDFRGRVNTIRETGAHPLIIRVDRAQTSAVVTTPSGTVVTTIKLDSKARTITVQDLAPGHKSTSVTQYNAQGCPVSRKNFFPDFTSTAARTCDTQNKFLQDKNVIRNLDQTISSDYTNIYAWFENGRQVRIYRL